MISRSTAGRSVVRARAGRIGAQPAPELLRLQRSFGNGVVSRLISRESVGSAVAVQRESEGDATKLSEGKNAEVASGGTITYTPLIGGCLAVTAIFEGGGAAGVHLVMDTSYPNQWKHFFAKINRPVAKLHLDSDMLGQEQGWRCQVPRGREPKSTLQLGSNLRGWEYDLTTVKSWFRMYLETEPIVSSNTSPTYTAP